MLAAFIKWLEAEGLAEFDVDRDDERGFRSRFRIQKHACIAKAMGMPLPYEHEMYLCGPCSTALAEGYYELAGDRRRLYDPAAPGLPASFRRDEYARLVRGRSDVWLQTAATLAEWNGDAGGRDDLVDDVCRVQHKDDRGFVEGVLRDLEAAGAARHRQAVPGLRA